MASIAFMRAKPVSLLGTLLVACVSVATLLNVAAFTLGAGVPELDLISSATPAILATGILVGAIALTFRYWLIAAAALLGAAGPPAIVVGVEVAAAARPLASQAGQTLKVVSLNIESGNRNLAALKEFILTERPDLLLLQEADQNDHKLLYEFLATIYPTIATNYPHCSTNVASTFVLVEPSRGTDCASAIIRLTLPDRLGGGELLAASIHLPNARHGTSGSEADVLRARMAAWANGNAIVAGDFNATPWSWAVRRFDGIRGFERWTRALATWPAPGAVEEKTLSSPMAFLPIDHVFATFDWRLVRARRGPAVGSDHYPVVIELARRSERLATAPRAE
jgi:endonuclease/exonuclease/phosphatase (EEP) superfamily protein YafD